MFDKDISIINKWYNSTTKQNEYIISHVKGFWSPNDGISISGTQLVKNDGLTARILMSETNQNSESYVEPQEFQKNKIGWTLQNDDYLVKGIVEEVTNIAELKSTYECMKITKVSKKNYGSTDMWHFAIDGE